MKKILLSIILLSVLWCHSQSISDDINNFESNTTLSSPDVYSFEKVNLTEVKKYVGKADVTIPIYEIKSGNLSYPIFLKYDTGGIKVDQLASDVGLGWSISQCLITRKVNKGNDFNTVGYKSQLNSNYTFATPLEQSMDVSVFLGFKRRLGYFMNLGLNKKISLDDRVIDFVPDEYNFYSNEFNTKFFFKTLTNPIELNPQGTIINATKNKFQFDAKIAYKDPNDNLYKTFYEFPTEDFFNMDITSKKGVKYTFNDYDLATTINWDFNGVLDYYFANNRTVNLNTIYVSALHISNIEDLQTGKKIYFEYDTTHSNPYNEYNATNVTSTTLQDGIKKTPRNYSYYTANMNYNSGQCFYWAPFLSTSAYSQSSVLQVQKKRLKRITYDEGTVEYKYNNDGGTVSGIPNLRQDIYNGDFLTKIIVKNNKGEVIKTLEFKYDYFNSNYNVGEFNPDGFNNTTRYKRLKLKEVQEVGKPAYVFSYEESIKLPPVNSFSIDFLGYFNSSPDISSLAQLQSINPNPKIWYYPNNFEKSVLPFPVPNQPVNMVNGYFDRQANINAKAWSLTQIDYPTGGFVKYEYESNTFKLFNENITGGGIRIAKQYINDGYNNQRVLEYSYLDDNGKSSGSLATIPYFGHPANKFFDVGIDDRAYPFFIYTNYPTSINLIHWKLFDKCNLNKDIVSGSYVGYSKVTEREVGRGKIENYFTSNDDLGFQNIHYKIHPQTDPFLLTIPAENPVAVLGAPSCMTYFLMANSAMECDTFTDNGYKRGKPTFEKIYNESNQLLRMSEISYVDNSYNSHAFLQPITYPIKTQGETNLGQIFNLIKKIEIKNHFKTAEKIYHYSNGNNLKEETNYSYNNIGLLTSKLELYTNKTLETKYYYANDPLVNNEPLISLILSKNLLVNPLKVETLANGSKISEKKTVYVKDSSTSNLLLQKYLYVKKGDDVNGILEKKLTKDLFDNKGNVIQYTKENSIPVCLIWGYNKTLLIAKIENATYSSISSLVAVAQNASDTQTEAQLISALSNIRTSLPNAMVTTYTHKPLVGVTSVTDPKGYMKKYTFDSNGRLIKVTDKNGLILSENEYFFQP
ncbi:RHS repeat domain-containing protein [Flavobacterium sp. 25HG05S-40]|uniref:RHS repeat domain-containing protein n=1 Tax=Flavobacterium sp. 25HG05S-40 TaxID=3458682 RepID=UPI0040447904